MQIREVKWLGFREHLCKWQASCKLTHFIAQVHCNITKEKILFAKFISIMCDGSIDSSITEQEIVGLYVRIVVCEKPETCLIGIARASAESITEAVVNSFKKYLELSSDL